MLPDKKSTKGLIIEAISQRMSLNLKDIFIEVKKQSLKSLSYQAVFKAVRELVDEGILIKEEKFYKISNDWIQQMKEFTNTISSRHSLNQAKPLLEVGYGKSSHENSYLAGKEAAENAFSKIKNFQDESRLVLVFSSVFYENSFDSLLDGIKSITNETPLLGFTTFGEIFDGKYNDSVVVVIFSAEEKHFSVQTSMVESKDNPKKLIENISFPEKGFGMIFFPGPSEYNDLTNIAPSFVNDLRKLLPPKFPLLGGVAADNSRLVKTYQFYDGTVNPDAILLAIVTTDVPFSIAVGHGYEKYNENEYYFKLQGNFIEKISISNKGKKSSYLPAISTYAKEISMNEKDLFNTMPYFTGPKRYQDWVALKVFARKDKPYVLSYPFDIKENLLIFTGIHDEKNPFILMDTSPEQLVGSLKQGILEAMEQMESDPIALIALPCAVYHIMVPPYINEIKKLKEIGKLKDVPIVGSYVNGEIGPYDNHNVDFCNGSFSCLILGK